mmetsp:Transcript_43321/g.85501  ORF Transcript_43321/g.85501 Transcript_43321/m.85501 type:complete len:337 (+) Transcript_43321:149-1159(+)
MQKAAEGDLSASCRLSKLAKNWGIKETEDGNKTGYHGDIIFGFSASVPVPSGCGSVNRSLGNRLLSQISRQASAIGSALLDLGPKSPKLLIKQKYQGVIWTHSQIVGCKSLEESSRAFRPHYFQGTVQRRRVVCTPCGLVHQPCGNQIKRLHCSHSECACDKRRQKVKTHAIRQSALFTQSRLDKIVGGQLYSTERCYPQNEGVHPVPETQEALLPYNLPDGEPKRRVVVLEPHLHRLDARGGLALRLDKKKRRPTNGTQDSSKQADSHVLKMIQPPLFSCPQSLLYQSVRPKTHPGDGNLQDTGCRQTPIQSLQTLRSPNRDQRPQHPPVRRGGA